MSQRTLLVIALALMAGGIVIGAAGQLLGGVTPVVQSENRPNAAQPGRLPGGQLRPGAPGFGREGGEGRRRPAPKRPGVVPSPKPTAKASPTASPTA